jgi:hypothetical protein
MKAVLFILLVAVFASQTQANILSGLVAGKCGQIPVISDFDPVVYSGKWLTNSILLLYIF